MLCTLTSACCSEMKVKKRAVFTFALTFGLCVQCGVWNTMHSLIWKQDMCSHFSTWCSSQSEWRVLGFAALSKHSKQQMSLHTHAGRLNQEMIAFPCCVGAIMPKVLSMHQTECDDVSTSSGRNDAAWAAEIQSKLWSQPKKKKARLV